MEVEEGGLYWVAMLNCGRTKLRPLLVVLESHLVSMKFSTPLEVCKCVYNMCSVREVHVLHNVCMVYTCK